MAYNKFVNQKNKGTIFDEMFSEISKFFFLKTSKPISLEIKRFFSAENFESGFVTVLVQPVLKVRFDFGVFGDEQIAESVAERVGYVVQSHSRHDLTAEQSTAKNHLRFIPKSLFLDF